MRSIWGWGFVLMGSTVMVAQTPLIKPGLWETTTVRNKGDGPPLTGKTKMCIAQADREKMMHPKMPALAGCSQNYAREARGYTFDLTCPKMQMQTHGSMTIVDVEHIEMQSEMSVEVNGATHRQVDRISSHFVSAQCGAVKPGQQPVVE